MEILFIVGSLRKGSFNRMIADTAMHELKGKAEVRFLDWKNLPVLNAEDTYPFGEQAEIVRTAIKEADALWIFCPEYNGAVPGGLKNVLDVASLAYEKNNYASGSPLRGKFCCISGAGGRNATKSAREALTTLLTRCGCKVCPDQLGIALPPASFSTGVWDMTQEEKENIEQQARIFLAWIHTETEKAAA